MIQAICCGTPRAFGANRPRPRPVGSRDEHRSAGVRRTRDLGPHFIQENHRYVPDLERVRRVADFARRLAVLRTKANSEKRVASC